MSQCPWELQFCTHCYDRYFFFLFLLPISHLSTGFSLSWVAKGLGQFVRGWWHVGWILCECVSYWLLQGWKGGSPSQEGLALRHQKGEEGKEPFKRLHFPVRFSWASCLWSYSWNVLLPLLSIGSLISRTVREAANLPGSSCFKFWEMLKKLSLLQRDTWAAAEVTEPISNGDYSLCCVWRTHFKAEGSKRPKALCKPAVSAPSGILCEISVTLVWLW